MANNNAKHPDGLRDVDGMALYTVKDLANVLGVTTRTIMRYISEEKIPARKIGNKWVVTEENLVKFIKGEI